MTSQEDETVEVAGRAYRRFIPAGQPVRDGTVRCVFCGQIDEPNVHQSDFCPATRRNW